jgi:hypothetical protein
LLSGQLNKSNLKKKKYIILSDLNEKVLYGGMSCASFAFSNWVKFLGKEIVRLSRVAFSFTI